MRAASSHDMTATLERVRHAAHGREAACGGWADTARKPPNFHVGTPLYLAPEVLACGLLPAVDVWALGLTLEALLTDEELYASEHCVPTGGDARAVFGWTSPSPCGAASCGRGGASHSCGDHSHEGSRLVLGPGNVMVRGLVVYRLVHGRYEGCRHHQYVECACVTFGHAGAVCTRSGCVARLPPLRISSAPCGNAALGYFRRG